ncbi:MAG: ABC-F family ATP-binding cassette domain-containing protein [Marinifilaceae bacterium]|jgi:ATP-binding cassette subfamily F protein 3|nr:ABC-F family ATP-binding cassette domain-containing protein [Marinifilaceae bacterium]
MISVNNLSVEFGGFSLFKSINFLVNNKDRIGLVGKNGAGKSTMLKVFAKEQEASSGNISIPKDLKIGYLPQQMKFSDNNTVMSECLNAFDEVNNLKKEIDRLNIELAERTDYESQDYLDIITKLNDKNDRFHLLGGENTKAESEKTLIGLGFKRTDFERQTQEFSGGWRMRIELAKILLKKPDIFLLDEPTNHLDIESIQWLEDFLKNYSGAVMLVSHDRAFLDNITNRTVELSLGKIYDYKVSYSKYVELHDERREQQMKAYINQQKQIKETEEFIERFRYKATKAVQVQSRIKQLEKIDRIEVDEEDNAMLNLKFSAAPRSGDLVLEIKELSKWYDQLHVLDDIELTINRGEKLAFVGKNGEGKSTLVNIIMNKIEYSGICNIGHGVKVGYFAQNQAQLLDENLTIFETIDNVAVGDIRTKIRDILAAFMFRGEDIDKKVKVLSGGERSRLAMIRLLLEPVNLLILDEPTNHLDMKSKDVLKKALKEFEGTVILVSHDREFLDGLVSRVFEFTNKKTKEHLGGIFEFLRAKQIENMAELEANKQLSSGSIKSEKNSDAKLDYQNRKELNKQITKLKKQLLESEENIASLEEKIANLEIEMANPSAGSDPDIYDNYNNSKKELEKEMEMWEERTIDLDEKEAQLNS